MVNVAARMEQLTRATKADVLVSEDVIKAVELESPNTFAYRQVSTQQQGQQSVAEVATVLVMVNHCCLLLLLLLLLVRLGHNRLQHNN